MVSRQDHEQTNWWQGSKYRTVRASDCILTPELSFSVLVFEPCQPPIALIAATVPESSNLFFNRPLQQKRECLILRFWQVCLPAPRKRLALGRPCFPGSLPVRARFPCQPRPLQHDFAGIIDKGPGTLCFIRVARGSLGGP